jgi:hypothetical protein
MKTKAAVAHFKIFQHFPGGTEGNHDQDRILLIGFEENMWTDRRIYIYYASLYVFRAKNALKVIMSLRKNRGIKDE